jgi:putative endonuclease
MERQPFVYIITNVPNGTLYIGVTTNLPARVWQHKNKTFRGYTEKYHLDKLVWYEPHLTIESAILREKQIKRWNRKWKLRIIEDMNPDWLDLYKEIV